MKKNYLMAIFTLCTICLNAQNFGVRAGADFATAKVKFEGLSISENETGFYIGLFTKIELSETFKIRPEANFIGIKDLEQIQIPLLAEVNLSDKFSVLVGPSFSFLLDSDEESKSLNLAADLGLSYNISENFFIETRYNLPLSNLAEDNEFDASIKLSAFQVGIGYMF
jgi:opacity protein-like surface antigen